MKAYKAWDTRNVEGYSTVVFAENAQKAKKVALGTDACEDADYINIRVQRLPEMDSHYRGKTEIDWYDMEDRKALVSLGEDFFPFEERYQWLPLITYGGAGKKGGGKR